MPEKILRDSFVFYRSFFVAISQLPKKYQLDTYQALAKYALDSDEISLNGISSAVLELCKPQIDANNRRFENGKKGGRRNQTETKAEPKQNQTETKAEPNVNVNVNVNDNVNENVNVKEKEIKRKSAFAPPTIDDVRSYCFERGNAVDPQRFIDYYESNGWKVGRNPMKDWKAAVRTWEQREAAPKKADNEAEIRQFYQQTKQLYPTDTGRDEGWETFRKKSKGDPKIARRIANCIGEMVEQYYAGTVGLNGLDKDIEVAYEHIRG